MKDNFFFDLYTYNLKQAKSILKLWLRCCPWVTFFGTIFFIERNRMICPDKVGQFYCKVRQLLQSGTAVPLNMPIIVDLWILHASLNLPLYWWQSTICISFTLLVFFITILWRLYYFSIVWSLTFYWHTALRYTVLKSFYFPTLSAKDIYLLDTQNWL